ncbi:RNA polymerase sigma factor [Streptomyces sp. NPDC008222]|uniref:RNA polymerase sigma factor n=1 Tax=Streptomyces sp. NPDC008222 TaxID=3364820 RepID=UPI0036EE95EF
MITKYEGDGVDPPAQAVHPRVTARFTEALKEVHPRIDHVVARLVRDRHLREDIVQHVDIALYLHIKRDDAFRVPIISWAYVVAKNKAISEFRRLKPEVAAGELPDRTPLFRESHSADPTAGIALFDLLRDVDRAIADPRQYRVWEMTHVAQLTGVEIARALGVSAATVSRDLNRAMAKASQIEP